MYERMLDKRSAPTIEEMTAYCGESGALFAGLNQWLSGAFGTETSIVFPYGNQYGWGVAHRKKAKLICNIFAEDGAFTVMMRLSDAQYQAAYGALREETRKSIDHRYPCRDGGWIHFRISGQAQLEDIRALLSIKCAPKNK